MSGPLKRIRRRLLPEAQLTNPRTPIHINEREKREIEKEIKMTQYKIAGQKLPASVSFSLSFSIIFYTFLFIQTPTLNQHTSLFKYFILHYSDRNMMKQPVLRESELRRLETCLREPEFRGLLLEYVRDITDNAQCYESELKAWIQSSAEEEGGSVEFLKPSAGFVLASSSSGVYLNLCSESKVSRPTPGETHNEWSIPYALPPARKHVLEDGKTLVTLLDVIFHPSALKKAIRNRRFKTALKETAIEAAISSHSFLAKESFSILPNVPYMGVPKTLLLRQKSPQYSLKYRENSISQLHGSRPEAAVIEIYLPEFSGAANIDLDVSRRSLTLTTKDPVPYYLHVPFSYPVDEEKGSAKFEKCTRKLLVTIPILPSKKMERLLSVDSGIGDVHEDLLFQPSPDYSEQEEEDSSERMTPKFSYELAGETLLSIRLDVKNVEPSSIVKSPFSNEKSSGYVIRFSTLGAGLVRYDYGFAFALLTPGEGHIPLEEPSTDLWDNALCLNVNLCALQALDLLCGASPVELRLMNNPSLPALRRDYTPTPSNIVSSQPLKSPPPAAARPASIKDRHSFSSEESQDSSPQVGRFSVTPLSNDSSEEEESNPLPPLPPVFSSSSCNSGGIRGILKRRVRSYSESQAEQLKRWEEAATSLLFHKEDGYILQEEEEEYDYEEEEEENTGSGKKSVRFNDHVQRQVFRANASILGQRQKNLKKNEQKKRKNALRQRRASEGDAQKEDSNTTEVGVFSEEKGRRSNDVDKDDALAEVFQRSEQLLFELDIE